MIIRTNTPERLVITQRPLGLAMVFGLGLLVQLWVTIALAAEGNWLGAAVMLFGAGVIGCLAAALVRRTDLILDRLSGEALLQQRTAFRKSWTTWPLSEVTGAGVQTARSRKGSTTHRPALCLSAGRMTAMTPNFTSGETAQQTVAAINRWLKRPTAQG